MKKIFLFTLMVFMVTLWSTLRAQENYKLYIAGIQVTSENAYNVTGNGITGSVSYDANIQTLTLDGVKIDAPNGSNAINNTGIRGLIIKLIGNNTVNAVGSNAGIKLNGNTAIVGNGSLVSVSNDNCGILIEPNTTLSINNKAIVEATNIYLSPLQKRVLKSELQLVTKSNNFTGPGLVATLSNRNLYNGGEILNISGKFGYETQFNSGGSTGLQTLLFGVESELIFSRVLFPIRINTDFFKHSIPKTRIALDVLYQNRSELYSLLGVTFSFGYLWNANRYVSHQVNPISINFLNLTNTSDQFQKILNTNPFIKKHL